MSDEEEARIEAMLEAGGLENGGAPWWIAVAFAVGLAVFFAIAMTIGERLAN